MMYQNDFLSSRIDSSQIAGLKSKVDSLHSLLLGRYAQEAVNYVGGNGFYSQESAFQEPFQQQSYSFSRNYGVSSYQAPPAPTHKSRLDAMMEQFLEGEQQITVSFNSKIDALHENLNGKFESLSTHVKKLDVRIQKTAGAIQRQNEAGKAEQKRYINAVTIRDGIDLLEEEGSIISDFPDEYCLSETCIDRHTLDVDRCNPDPSDEIEHNRLVSIDTPYASIDTNRRRDQKPATVLERVYKPSVPYPKVPKLSKQELEVANCTKDMKKKLIQIREKLPDPGAFVLDCSISKGRFKRSLCDLGSCVNLMPYSVAVRLGKMEFQPTRISLILVDCSKRYPEGVLKDISVRVGNYLIPTDFVVLKYEIEPDDPLLLGRSFLATAGAVIDVRRGLIDLQLGDKPLQFKMDKLQKSTIDGQSFSVEMEPDVPIGEEKMAVHSELALTSSVPATAHKQKAPDISFPPKVRHKSSKLKPPDRIALNAGKRSIPLKLCSHPDSTPSFLGRSHDPTAYTPPWMRRHSQRHSKSLLKPT